MKREPIDLTDDELYSVCLAIKSHLNSRDTYMGKKGARNFNSLIKKLTDNGLKRKDKTRIHPIYTFPEDLTP